MGIQHDLAIGRVGENLVRKLFATQNETILAVPRSTYDVEMINPLSSFVYSAKSGKPLSLTIEVKYDLYANKSGNIAIEIFNPKTQKDSGLRVTIAQLWAHIIPTATDNNIWITQTNWLRSYIAETSPTKILVNKYQNATLKLYPKEKILHDIFVLMTPAKLPQFLDFLNDRDTDQWII